MSNPTLTRRCVPPGVAVLPVPRQGCTARGGVMAERGAAPLPCLAAVELLG